MPSNYDYNPDTNWNSTDWSTPTYQNYPGDSPYSGTSPQGGTGSGLEQLLTQLAGGGLSLLGGKKGSDAAKEAAALQAQTAQQALAFQKQIYEEQKAQKAPYVAQGATSLAALGRTAGAQQQQVLPSAYSGQTLGQLGQQIRTAQAQSQANPTQAQQQAAATAVPTPGGMPPGAPPTPGAGPGQIPNDELVTVEAPTGETRQVPMALARQMVAKGARIVDGRRMATGGRMARTQSREAGESNQYFL
jgi:hypothetical protein